MDSIDCNVFLFRINKLTSLNACPKSFQTSIFDMPAINEKKNVHCEWKTDE